MRRCIIFQFVLVLVWPIISSQFLYPNNDACTTPHGWSGTCINIKSCPVLLSALQKRPLTPETINFLKRSQCGYEGSEPKVCCGKNVTHCVAFLTSNLKLVGVRVGEHNLKTEKDCANVGTEEEYCNERYQDFTIEQVIYHPDYTVRTLRNDIALIRLNRNIDFKPENARPICMPIGSAATIPTKKLTVTGWGVINYKQESSPIMLKVNLPRFPQDECMRVYKQQTEVWYKQICMGGEDDKDSCTGDSGGPLQAPAIYRGLPRIVQYGLVSFGVKNCGNPRFPGVYTRIDYADYLDWILDNLKD